MNTKVENFVDFLPARNGSAEFRIIDNSEWTNAEFADMSMLQAVRGMENEPLFYAQDDLKERW
ncbi:DUF2281 domain-containing protein [Lamprobacter modestohalophilus]|uniref:DUF2281 domain-containing protein n=1 Tax=Lamprobacter modestohalophilus TaxID=1064514 RepID=UPI002ADEC08D|nr:DUF2281 domain-containing protein [Lamprobacter modestohalophilus]MEA1052260.1 DUF2281 domain-containing protein [Lamprobacter modestohalophilus]